MRRGRGIVAPLIGVGVSLTGLAAGGSPVLAFGTRGRVLLASMAAPRGGYFGDDQEPWGEAGLAADASGRLLAIDPGLGFAVARVTSCSRPTR
jgi:hypothetical protein